MCQLSKLRKTYYPKPPRTLAEISGAQIISLLKPYGINLRCPLDAEYGLPSKEDWHRFLRWYKANAPVKPSDYTVDNFDCDDFAWIMRAEALKWMKGECVFGYVEASSVDENYPYPMHAFCFFVDWNSHVYFTDHLEVAASVDGLDPAYEVHSQDAKV